MKYTTVLGDTFDIIAFKIYKDEKKAIDIMNANLDHINILVFSAGIVLNIPEVKETNINTSLPPWKRGGF